MTDFLLNLDMALLREVLWSGTPWANRLWFNVTMLGKSWVVAALGLGAVVYFWRFGYAHYVLPFLAAISGSTFTTFLLKYVISRPRPPEAFAYYAEKSASFPSGHATAAVALYGFLVYFVCKNFFGWWRSIIIFLSSVLIVAIGFSRLYLGVHYLSDVIAGYAVGALWLILSIEVFKKRLPLARE